MTEYYFTGCTLSYSRDGFGGDLHRGLEVNGHRDVDNHVQALLLGDLLDDFLHGLRTLAQDGVALTFHVNLQVLGQARQLALRCWPCVVRSASACGVSLPALVCKFCCNAWISRCNFSTACWQGPYLLPDPSMPS